MDIHDYQGRLDSVIRRLEADKKVIKENKKDIFRFKEQLEAEGISKGRIFKYIWCLRNISGWLKKPFKQATKEDVVRVVAKIHEMKKKDGKPFSVNTIHEYLVSFKRFYPFLYNLEKGKYPKQVDWIKLTKKKRDQKLPEEILTEDEVKKIAEQSDNPRDRLLILLLFMTGCRASEIISLKLKHVAFDDYGAKLTVEGKTGMRVIRVVGCESELREWYNKHPFKDFPESYLFIPLGDKNRFEDKPISYTACSELVKRLSKRAGITKRIYLHLWRHSSATFYANKLTEQQLKAMFGWTADSRSASVYVHMSMRDLDDAILKINGINNERNIKPKLTTKICPRCKTKNSPISKFCSNCSYILDDEILRRQADDAKNYQGTISDTFKILERENPAFIEAFNDAWNRAKHDKFSKMEGD
jgi:integrase